MLSVSSATSTRLRLGAGDCDSNSITPNTPWSSAASGRVPARASDHRNAVMKPMPFELPVEGAAADAEQPRCDRLVSAHLLQRANDVVSLDFDERYGIVVPLQKAAATRRLNGSWRCKPLFPHASREVGLGDEVAFGQ